MVLWLLGCVRVKRVPRERRPSRLLWPWSSKLWVACAGSMSRHVSLQKCRFWRVTVVWEYHDVQMHLFPVFVLIVNMLLSVWDNRVCGPVNRCLLQWNFLSLFLWTAPISRWLRPLPSERDLGENSQHMICHFCIFKWHLIKQGCPVLFEHSVSWSSAF